MSGAAGIGTGVLSIAGVTSSVAAGTAGTLATVAAAAIPIVGLAAAAIAILAQFVGKGCGAACIESAQLEQVFEIAADLIYCAAVLGMVTPQEGAVLIQAAQQYGDQQMQALAKTDPSAKQGQANMDSVLAAENSATLALVPGKPSKWGSVVPTTLQPLDMNAVYALWTQHTTVSGWYSQDLGPGQQLAEQLLQTAVSQGAATTGSTAGNVLTTAEGAVQSAAAGLGLSISPTVALIAIGLVVAFLVMR